MSAHSTAAMGEECNCSGGETEHGRSCLGADLSDRGNAVTIFGMIAETMIEASENLSPGQT